MGLCCSNVCQAKGLEVKGIVHINNEDLLKRIQASIRKCIERRKIRYGNVSGAGMSNKKYTSALSSENQKVKVLQSFRKLRKN